jgi:hypothetical protein
MKRSTVAALAIFFLAGLALGWAPPRQAAVRRPRREAQTADRPSPRPGDAILESSRAYVFVGKSGLGHEHAIVGRVSAGRIVLGAAEDAGFLEFDMTSFVADTQAARDFIGLEGEVGESTRQKVTENMCGADVLNVAKHPTARFAIARAVPLKKRRVEDPQRYELTGDFTLCGTTQPIRIVADVERLEDGVRLVGKFSILQSDFGIEPYSTAFGAVGVADELTIWGDVRLAAEARP